MASISCRHGSRAGCGRLGLVGALLAVCSLFGSAGALPRRRAGAADPKKRGLSIKGKEFVLEQGGTSHAVQLHAGELHYFRVPEVHWEDRLLRLRAMGLNAVSTYVPWNWHEQVEGVFDFTSDRKDLAGFLRLAHKHGLLAILRPGPYICSEWDFGGLPGWLLAYIWKDGLKFRTGDRKYLELVDRFWGDLLPRVQPLLLEEGGPVAVVQLENEYGHFGNAAEVQMDREYLEHLESTARKHLGPRVLLITTDSASHTAKGRGSLPHMFSAINLGPWYEPKSHLAKHFDLVEQHNKGGPEFVMELWTGWFQTWVRSDFTEGHFRQPGQQLVSYVKELLDRNASFTLYMAHGGTNFGFWNAGTAVVREEGYYRSSFITTSYDYAAPISEEGRHGFGGDGVDKYAALRELLKSHRGAWEPPLPDEPRPPILATYRGQGPGGAVQLFRRVPLRDPVVLAALCDGGWQREPGGLPRPMEAHGGQQGLALYRFRPEGSGSEQLAGAGSFLSQRAGSGVPLHLKARDRVTVWSDGKLLAKARDNTLYGAWGRLGNVSALVATAMQAVPELDVLVEHLGRRAFIKREDAQLDMPDMYEDWKGLADASLGGRRLQGDWQYCALPLADLYASGGAAPEPSAPAGEEVEGPAFFEGRFSVVGDPLDTFLTLEAGAWRTGAAYVNGFNVGRYRRGARGPFDFYVPKSTLRRGANTVVLLEMDPPAGLGAAGAIVLSKATRGPMLQ